MKLFIPVVGTRLLLLAPTTVSLKNEGQNTRFIESLGASDSETASLTLPRGTVLTVDRVYIRQGDSPEFNSLTFKVMPNEKAGIPRGRFFLSVDVVNTLDVDVVQDKPAPKVLTPRSVFSSFYARCTSQERLSDVPFMLLMEQMNACPTVLDGSLQVDVMAELALLEQAIMENVRYEGEASFDLFVARMRSVVSKEMIPFIDGALKNISDQKTAVQLALKHSAHEVLYHFRTFRFNDEPALWLNPLIELPALTAIHAAEKSYRSLFAMLLASKGRSGNALSELRWPSLIGRLKSFPYQDGFGLYYRKNNYSPKAPIVNVKKTEGLIPSDAFGDNLFTRTKNEDHGHEFIYQLSTGQRVTTAALRKLM